MIHFPHLKTYFNIYKKRLEEASTTCWANNNIYINNKKKKNRKLQNINSSIQDLVKPQTDIFLRESTGGRSLKRNGASAGRAEDLIGFPNLCLSSLLVYTRKSWNTDLHIPLVAGTHGAYTKCVNEHLSDLQPQSTVRWTRTSVSI